MNTNTTLIQTLGASRIYQDYERCFTEATGLPVSLRPVDACQLPFRGKRRENPFCALMAGKSRTCAACLQSQERLSREALTAPATITCAYGLCETAVPVKLGAQTIGFLQTGQVLRQQPTAPGFDRVVRQFNRHGADLDLDRAREAFFQTPVVSPARIESLKGLLNIFADHLSARANALAMAQANSEPPMIARARQFILEHLSEDLSLGRVAQAVHTSVFYFCKMFRKTTGLHFTEFVSRARTEKAKNLLLNPNLRVSEIAYEVGFQSLTHFNRVFKKITGQSPTEYRSRLPAARHATPTPRPG